MIIRSAGRTLVVGELREALAGLRDDDGVTAHGQLVGQVEVRGDQLALDDDVDVASLETALDDLLEFVKQLRDDKGMKLREARVRAADLMEEWGYLA